MEGPEAEDSTEQRSGAMAPLAVADIVSESPEETIIDYELSLRPNNLDMKSNEDGTVDCEKIKQLWTERMANNWTPVKEEHNK